MTLRTKHIVLAAIALSLPLVPVLAAGGQKNHPVAQFRLKQMEKRLELTDVQQAQVKGVLDNLKTQLEAIHKDTGLSKDERKAKLMALKQSAKGQIDQILTPEQREKLEKARKKP